MGNAPFVYFGIFIGILLLAFFIGWLVTFPFKRLIRSENIFLQLFFRLFSGVLTITVLYALWRSGGQTIQLLLIPLVGYMVWYYYRQQKQAEKKSHDNAVKQNTTTEYLFAALFLVLVSALVFIYKLSAIYVGGEVPYVLTSGNDYAFYGNVAQSLTLTGAETNLVPQAYLIESWGAPQPYHYFDLWLTGFISKVTGIVPVLCLELITYPLFLFITVTGIAGLISLSTKNWYLIPFPLLVLFFGHVHIQQYDKITYLSSEVYQMQHLGSDLTRFSKLIHLGPFALLLVYFFRRQMFEAAITVLLVVACIYVGTLPALLGGGALFSILLWKPFSIISLKRLGHILLLIVAFGLFFTGFYKIFGSTIGGVNSGMLDLFDATSLKTRINIVGLSVIQLTVLYFPISILIGIVIWVTPAPRKKMLIQAVVFALCVVSTGLLGWAILFKHNNGVQLLGNPLVLVNLIMVTIVLSAVRFGSKRGRLAVLALFALVLLFQTTTKLKYHTSRKHQLLSETYSANYLASLGRQFSGHKNMIGAYFKGSEEYNHPKYAFAHKYSQAFKMSWPLTLYPQYFSTVNLSVYDIPEPKDAVEKARQQKYLATSPFIKFVQENSDDEMDGVNIDSMQLAFLKHYNIQYVLSTPSAKLPKGFNKWVKSSFTDSISGEQFHILKGDLWSVRKGGYER